MNNFNETVLNNWLEELKATIVSNSMSGANRDGMQVWSDDDESKLYSYCAASDDGAQAYDLTIDGAKQLESENDLQYSVKGYKSVDRIHDEKVEKTIDLITAVSLNEWLSNSDEKIISVDDLENDQISWDLLADLMNRQRKSDDNLLSCNFIYCGLYEYNTKGFDFIEDLYTFEEWSDLLETDETLYDTIMEYA